MGKEMIISRRHSQEPAGCQELRDLLVLYFHASRYQGQEFKDSERANIIEMGRNVLDFLDQNGCHANIALEQLSNHSANCQQCQDWLLYLLSLDSNN